LTGPADDDVRGKAVADGDAGGLLTTADAILSHKGTCDCAFLIAGLLRPDAWIYSLHNLD
jgi:hypothetical protein